VASTPWDFSTVRRILFIGVSVPALLTLPACGGAQNSGGPVGTPESVVTRAPDTTLAAGTAQVAISSPTADATGAINFNTRDGRLAVSCCGQAKPSVDLVVVGGAGYAESVGDRAYAPLPAAVPEILAGGDPWADIDLVRGTVHILSNGGNEIAGVSTISYTLTIDPQQAIETTPPARQAALRSLLGGRSALFQIIVWIDSQFRLRSLEVPTEFAFAKVTPPTRVDGEYIASTVDFVSFGVAVPPVTVPATSVPPGQS
jgi:hypothetical protein